MIKPSNQILENQEKAQIILDTAISRLVEMGFGVAIAGNPPTWSGRLLARPIKSPVPEQRK